MTPFLLVKPISRSLEWAFPLNEPTILRVSRHQISARVGQQYLPIRVLQAPDGRVRTDTILRHLARGHGIFVVNRELQKGALITFLDPPSFPSILPQTLGWDFLSSQASALVDLPPWSLFEGGEL